jgi:processive 1,2-diacylglycerol beta-glucosyltransferase
VHSQWLHPGVDRYYVGAEEVKAGMVRRGIDPDRVVVSGIPVHPAFALPVDADDVRAELGVARDFVVLFMAGAYGLIGGFDAVLRAVAGEALEATLLVVAGRDEGLRRALTGAPVHPQNQLLVLGFRDDVHRLMAASDLLVSKAGGLTTSEAMARGLPMVVFRPIPGQEEHNVRLLLSRGAGVLARTVPELCRLLRELRRDRARRADMQRAARALGRPQAAATVAQDLVNVFC